MSELTDLETSLKFYNDTVATANLNLDEVPVKVRSGREGAKRQAQANLENARKGYGERLHRSTFGLAVTGSSADEFVKRFTAEVDTALVVDGAQVYKRIADRIAPAMGNTREFGVSHYSAMITELRQIADELNVLSMPSPKWTEPVNVGDEAGLLAHVKNMVDSSAGIELTSLYLKNQIVTAGLAAESDGPTVPVLVTGLDPSTARDLLARTFPEGRSTLVNAVGDMTKEEVQNVINKIKNRIASNKTKNN